MFVFINGKIKSRSELHIDPFDLGFTRGFGVFAYMRTYNNKVFCLERHIRGFLNSAKIIGLEHNYTEDYLLEQVDKVLQYNNIRFANIEKSIKMILTGGISNSMRQVNKTNPTLMIIVDEFIPLDKDQYIKGVKLKTYMYLRDYPGSKTLNYIQGVKLLSMDDNKNIFEPLYLDPQTKHILETSNSNFFIIKNNILYTQKNNIFKGVIRDLLLGEFGDILIQKGIIKDVKEIENISCDDISSNICEGIFITGAAKEIMPIREIADDYDNVIYADSYGIEDNLILQTIIKEWIIWSRDL